MKALRKSVEPPQKEKVFSDIIEKLRNLEFYKKASTIMAYYGKTVSGEFNTKPLLNQILQDGKKLVLPRCFNSGTINMSAYEIQNLKTDLELGLFDILEPKPREEKKIGLDKIDVVIVPGLAFDHRGMRYGYGVGYYDNFLQNKPGYPPYKIALSFDFCVTPFKLKKKPHDVLIDGVITDKKVLLFFNTNQS